MATFSVPLGAAILSRGRLIAMWCSDTPAWIIIGGHSLPEVCLIWSCRGYVGRTRIDRTMDAKSESSCRANACTHS